MQSSLLPKSIYKNSGKFFLIIKARPGSKKEGITEISDEHVGVSIKAPPVEGKANLALISYLSDIFDLSKSDVVLEKGSTNKNKLISINYEYTEEEILNILNENKI